MQQAADAVGEVGGQRHAAAGVGRDHGIAVAAFHALGGGFADADEAQQPAGEHEGVAGAQHVDEVFLDLAEGGAEAALADKPDLQQRRLDDGADVHPQCGGGAGVADVHPALAVAEQLLPLFVGAQGVAAVLDEAQHVVEIVAGQGGVGGGGDDLAIDVVGQERGAAGEAEQMLRQHVQAAGARRVAVQFAGRDAEDRGLAFQHLEAVGGDQDGLRCLVHAVVGAADALQQAGNALRRADLDDLIDAAPVDAEVERRGGHHRAQAARRPWRLRPCGAARPPASRDAARSAASLSFSFHSAWNISSAWARVLTKTMVMPAALDVRHDLGRGFQAHVAGPGQAALRQGHRQFGRRAVGDLDAAGGAGVGLDGVGMRDGGGQADAAGGGRQGAPGGRRRARVGRRVWCRPGRGPRP